jgi:hypothetical protein
MADSPNFRQVSDTPRFHARSVHRDCRSPPRFCSEIERDTVEGALHLDPAFSHSQGQSLPKCDVRLTSVYPSISDMIVRRDERRNGPTTNVRRRPVALFGTSYEGLSFMVTVSSRVFSEAVCRPVC